MKKADPVELAYEKCWEVDTLTQNSCHNGSGKLRQPGRRGTSCWAPPSCSPMSWSNPQTFARVQPFPVGHRSQLGICWKPWKHPQSWHVQVWKTSLRDVVASEAQWVDYRRRGLQALGFSDWPQDQAQPYIRTGSFFIVPCWIWKHVFRNRYQSMKENRITLTASTLCMYSIHTLHTHLQNIHIASKYPYKASIQGTQSTYPTAHIAATHCMQSTHTLNS